MEPEFRAQPTCYVRKAQLAYEDHQYSELWAIYDKDAHPRHLEAYELSRNKNICNKQVNLGFSSISFEQWILMHFEYCGISFLKSQCRDKSKNDFGCGTHKHKMDCNGKYCVVGRIVEKGYIAYNASKNFDYTDYSNKVDFAFKNALLCREQANNNKFFENNPYTTIDRLVYKLRNIGQGDLIWEYT